MKDIFLKILREIGLLFAILIVLAAVTVFAFSSQLPYDEKVPSGEEYVKVNRNTYSVSSTDRISEINKITITHETNPGQIISAENEVRILTGKYTPFGTIDSTTDIPSERVGVSVAVSDSSKNEDDDGKSTDTENKESLNYPSVLDDQINDSKEKESESSSSAAARRMGNVE